MCFVVMQFAKSPKGFPCLYMSKSKSFYYNSLKNQAGRPYNDYPQSKDLGDIEVHIKPEFYQDECGCMELIRYCYLFNRKPVQAKGKHAHNQVLNLVNKIY